MIANIYNAPTAVQVFYVRNTQNWYGCSICKQEVDENDNFCKHCGAFFLKQKKIAVG